MPTLDFRGKHHIYAHHLSVPLRPLIPDPSLSLNSTDVDDNLIIHGDNLNALKALLPRYTGQVNCIYIDPPYNTGNEGWIYNDRVNSPLMKGWLEQNSPVDGEDLERHDKWLCMMWPRLHLLRELLSEEGVIFVSIDDNEHHHLRMLMDHIFGEVNFLANIVWQHRYGRSNNASRFSTQREFVIVYRKSDMVSRIRVKRDEALNETYSNPDNDQRGKWSGSSYVNPATKEERPKLVYPLVNPHTGVEVNHPTHAWKYNECTYDQHVKDDRLWWGADGDYTYPRLKVFLSESEAKGIVPIDLMLEGRDLMLAKCAGTTDEGTRQLQTIFQNKAVEFNNPKPPQLIENLIGIAEGVSGRSDTIILDSFAGSGTTAQSVLTMNQEDGGSRKFILVECEEYADSITAERVRRVIGGVPNASDELLQEGLGGSFTYCTLGDPLDLEQLLSGDSLPDFSTMAAYLLHTAAGIAAIGSDIKPQNRDGLFFSNEETNYFLLYEPNLEFLLSNGAMLGEAQAKRIHSINTDQGKKSIVFGSGQFISQSELTDMGITFCQLPYAILRNS